MTLFSEAMRLLGTNPVVNSTNRPLKKLTSRQLIKLESEIGAQLFGPVEKGRRREFFCLDENTWIWHEQWLDEHRRIVSQTVRYEVQDKGILKIQDGGNYSYITGTELNNLILAVRLYYERVMRELYKVDPHTGKSLV